MKNQMSVIAGAVLVAAASVQAAPAAPFGTAPALDAGTIQNVQYYDYHHSWHNHRYEPWVWRYQRSFPSRGTTDFYGSRSFHGS